MAIFVNTEKPAELVQRIRDAINNKNIDTNIAEIVTEGDFLKNNLGFCRVY